MRRVFTPFGLAVLVCSAALMTLLLENAMATKGKTLVDVQDVSVQKIEGNLFRITAKGVVRTSGWMVNLHPVVYIKPPDNWMMDAVGIKPTAAVQQVITPWEASIEMSLPKETVRVSVRGASLKGEKQTITKSVPR